MTTSTIEEEKPVTKFTAGELYTNGDIILLCTIGSGSMQCFSGVIVYKYPSCLLSTQHMCYIGAVWHIGSDSKMWPAENFRKFQGKVTIKS